MTSIYALFIYILAITVNFADEFNSNYTADEYLREGRILGYVQNTVIATASLMHLVEEGSVKVNDVQLLIESNLKSIAECRGRISKSNILILDNDGRGGRERNHICSNELNAIMSERIKLNIKAQNKEDDDIISTIPVNVDINTFLIENRILLFKSGILDESPQLKNQGMLITPDNGQHVLNNEDFTSASIIEDPDVWLNSARDANGRPLKTYELKFQLSDAGFAIARDMEQIDHGVLVCTLNGRLTSYSHDFVKVIGKECFVLDGFTEEQKKHILEEINNKVSIKNR